MSPCGEKENGAVPTASRQRQVGAIGTRDLVVQRQKRLDFHVDLSLTNALEQTNNRVISNPSEVFAFLGLEADIQTGIKRCAGSCPYYGYCGAGAPANKYYENGSFASTQTLYCRYAVQMPLDIILNDMERALNLAT
jgi:sulfatase maturation enzyme AslB (radical SAM superfamily)